jgi:hypothetical protein
MIKLIGVSVVASVFMLSSIGAYASTGIVEPGPIKRHHLGHHPASSHSQKNKHHDDDSKKAAASSSDHKAPIGSLNSNGQKLPRHSM